VNPVLHTRAPRSRRLSKGGLDSGSEPVDPDSRLGSRRSNTVDLVMVLVSVALLAMFAGLVWAMELL